MTDQVGGLVASAGKALEALGGRSDEAGWELDLDAPQSTVGTEQQGSRQAVGVLLAVAAIAVAIVMLFVLKDLLDGKYHHRQAVTIALAGGVVLVVLSLVAAAWRALANSDARVRLKLRRVAPTPGVDPALLLADLAAELAGAPVAAAAPGGAGAPGAKNVDAKAGSGTSTTPAQAKSPIAKEPVIVGSGLVAAGILAIGLAANLGPEEVAAIAAGASALVGLLLRQQVTSLAEPKDAQKNPLTPKELPDP
jgi:hypothetical protein